MESEIAKIYGNRVRVRACGICWMNDQLLLVNHRMANGDFWAPPGGGVEFGEHVADALIREFKEETNLTIEAGAFLFGCEFIQSPLHAVELFFDVKVIGGELRTGADPELQLIRNARLFSPSEVQSIPREQAHGIFRLVADAREISALKGFYTL
jgi:8-oxo-dGTP diphosphatase